MNQKNNIDEYVTEDWYSKTEGVPIELIPTSEVLHHDSTIFFDNLDKPTSLRDKKNMRILDNSRNPK